MGGSSKKVTVGYKYYLGMHMVMCHGPIDYITKIKVDDRLAWSGFGSGGTISINKPGLFGGEDREGGISGPVDIEMGGPSQLKNSYLSDRLGDDIPAFRGVVSAILRQVYLGLNPYLKRWSFRGQRVYTRKSGEAQWYPSTAGIVHRDSSLLVFDEDWSGGLSGYTLSSGTFDDFAISGGALQITGTEDGGISRINKTFSESDWSILRLEFNPVSVGTGTSGTEDVGVFHIEDASGNLIVNFTGVRDQTVDPLRRAHLTFLSGQTGLYMSDEMLELNRWYKLELVLNRSTNAMYGTLSVRDTGEVIKSATGLSLFSYAKAAQVEFRNETAHGDGGVSLWDNVQIYAGEQVDMNPSHIIRECLTDPIWGMGYLEADIDDDSFTKAADKLYSESMGISLLWDRQIAIEEFIGEIIRHINATLYVDRVTGLFTLKLIRDDYDENNLITLDESNITKVTDYSRVDPGDAINSVSVVYWDYKTGKNGSVTVDDVALIQSYGSVVNTTIQYPGFTSVGLASRAAGRDLKTLSSPLLSATIEANREASGLNIGDVFKFEWPDYHDGYVLMRVMQVALGDGKSNRVKITASEDIFSLASSSVIVEEEPGWEEPGGAPIAVPYKEAQETPYYEIVQLLGQTTTDLQLEDNPDLGYLQVSATRPDNGLNANLWVDSGGGYSEGGPLDFSPHCTLSSPLLKSQNSITYTLGEDMDQVILGQHCEVNGELMRVDSLDELTSTIVVGRGVLDTTPQDHPQGSLLVFWDNYSAGDSVEYVAGESLDVKVLTNSSEGSLDLSSDIPSSFIMNSRAWRPYPPGNLKIDSQYYPQEHVMGSSVSLTWSHRDRLQQTDGYLYDHTESDIGPEAGTTYTVKLWSADENDNKLSGVPYLEADSIATTSYNYDVVSNPPPGGTVRVIFEIWSSRGGYDSWMPASVSSAYVAAPDSLTAIYKPFTPPDGLEAINY